MALRAMPRKRVMLLAQQFGLQPIDYPMARQMVYEHCHRNWINQRVLANMFPDLQKFLSYNAVPESE